jgi:hypothetical protein
MRVAAGCCSAVSLTFVLLGFLGACGAPTNAYFPLEEGLQWRYDIDVITMDGPQKKKFLVSNIGPAKHQGQTLSVRASADGGFTYYRIGPTGVLRIGESGPDSPMDLYAAPRLVMPAKVDQTAAWTDTEFTVTLEHTGPPEHSLNRITVPVNLQYKIEATDAEVTVPAGTFRNCLRIKGVGTTSKNVGFYVGQTDIRVENTEWYAPGTGLVKAVRIETTTSKVLPRGSYELNLTSFTRD